MKANPYRWVVLGVFSLAAGLSQLLWLNFAPLLEVVEKRYGVSENQAGLLLLVFPLVYMLISVPVGTWIDRYGYLFNLTLGTVLMAIFSCFRIFEGSFWLLFIAQTGIAIAQPFVVNAISKLVLDWFDTKQAALANGIGTMGMFIGMAIGLAATPALVERIGYASSMEVFAFLATLVSVAVLFLADTNPAHPNQGSKAGSAIRDLKLLLKRKGLLLIFFLAFLGLGFFNGLTTWIEPILQENGLNSVQTGLAGATLIFGGIVGAALIPGLSDYFRRHKPFLLVSIAIALMTLHPLCNSTRLSSVLLFAGVQGFFFLPAFALLLAMCAELAGERLAGAATGILMLLGNAGGVVVIVAMEWIKSDGSSKPFQPSIALLMTVLGFTLLAAFFTKETHPALNR